MHITQADLNNAYDAWKAATVEHQRAMAAVMHGEPLNVDHMHQQLAEIEQLHEDWMRKAEPFVRRKP